MICRSVRFEIYKLHFEQAIFGSHDALMRRANHFSLSKHVDDIYNSYAFCRSSSLYQKNNIHELSYIHKYRRGELTFEKKRELRASRLKRDEYRRVAMLSAISTSAP